MFSKAWLNYLVLVRPIGMVPQDFNSNTLLSTLVLLFLHGQTIVIASLLILLASCEILVGHIEKACYYLCV